MQKNQKKIGDTPLIAKVGYYSPAQQPLLEQVVLETKDYVGAFSAINTIQAAVVDEKGEQLLPGEGRLKSGICGAGIQWAGIDMVKRLSTLKMKHSLNYEIIGVGGVATVDDFTLYRDAGADVVQSVTAAMWNDKLASQIKTTL